MKHIFLFTLATIVGLTEAYAQKFGHTNVQEILISLPEVAGLEQQINALQTEFQSQIEEMRSQLLAKEEEFQEKSATWPSAILQQKELEYQQLMQGLQDFARTAETEIAQKSQDLLFPLQKKVQEAIMAVGEEQGYTYIFDTGSGFLVYNNGDDVTDLVKTKLGL